MNVLKKIEPIEPFNDIFYKDCFFNSLFPILPLYGKNALSFLLNDMICYERDIHTGFINVKFSEFQEITDTLYNQGLTVQIHAQMENIVEALKEAILKNNPVIIRIDCFYSSIRPDMYQKVHFIYHTLLVFGFDEIRQIFFVVEHKERDNLNYEKREMSYKDIANCFYGFLSNIQEEEETLPAYYEFMLNQENDRLRQDSEKMDTTLLFVTNMVTNRDWFINSQHELRAFIEFFRLMVEDEMKVRTNAEGLMSNLNHVINAKKVEKYRLNLLFTNQKDLLDIMDEIIVNWNKVRLVVGKFYFSDVFKREAFTNLIECLERIEQLEAEIYMLWEKWLSAA
jgi:hypothetical protein